MSSAWRKWGGRGKEKKKPNQKPLDISNRVQVFFLSLKKYFLEKRIFMKMVH